MTRSPDEDFPRHTEDSEMYTPRRPVDPSGCSRTFVATGEDEVTDQPHWPDEPAFDEEWWFGAEADATTDAGPLRVTAIEVTIIMGDVSRKTRVEFDGGKPVEVWGINGGVLGEELYVKPVSATEDEWPKAGQDARLSL